MSLKNPFPGLRPFEPEESHLFFGREAHIAEIIRKLETFRFVSVVGNSGSGKSSLVRAGVLPRIRNEHPEFQISILRPGHAAVRELAQSLIQQKVINNTPEKQVFDVLQKSKLGLVQAIRPELEKGKKLLLVVDQFEELFRFSNTDNDVQNQISTHFVDLLLGAIGQKDVPIYVLMTIRTDFLGDCEQFQGLPEAINDGQFLVPRLKKEELQRCLTGPVQVANGKISPRLVHQLISTVGNNPDQLPVLQHAMMRTWEVWEDEGQLEQPMDIAQYEQTGGIQKALSNHAEEAFAELNPKQKEIAEFLFKTITKKGQDNRGVRRPTSVKKIAEIAQVGSDEIIAVAEVFRSGDRGFIMPPKGISLHSETILDISHESLMRVWDRLRDWVEEEGDSSDLYMRITESALLYQQGMAGLWRDPDLQIALDWMEKNKPTKAWAEQYNKEFDSASRFIEASKNEKQYERNERRRRRLIRNIAVIAALVMLSGLSVWAISERNNASMSANIANEEKNKATEQQKLAEASRIRAENGEAHALEQQEEAEKQKKIAENKAIEASEATKRAQAESDRAVSALSEAESARLRALKQQRISDSLRYLAEISAKKINQLAIRSIAQNLAIRSSLLDESDKDLKALLALQAMKFNIESGEEAYNRDIYLSLFEALRSYDGVSKNTFRYHNDEVKSIAFFSSTDLISAGSDSRIVLNFGLGSSNKSTLQTPFIFNNITMNQGKDQFALSTDAFGIQVYDRNAITTPKKEFKSVHSMEIVDLAWHKDLIISASLDQTLKITEVKSGKIIQTVTLDFTPMCLALDGKNQVLYIGNSSGAIFKTDLNNASALTKVYSMQDAKIQSLAIAPSGTKLAFGTSTGYCAIIDPINGKLIRELAGHTAQIRNIYFSADESLLATACLDRKARLYHLSSVDERPVVFDDHSNWVTDVSFSSDNRFLASASRDKTIILYPIDLDYIVQQLGQNVTRNLTKEEWEEYVGNDVPYEKTLASL